MNTYFSCRRIFGREESAVNAGGTEHIKYFLS